MKKNNLIIIAVIIAFVFIIAVNGCSTYNNLVNQSEEVDKCWAKVENQYQRRFDLIPNLVQSVKGYAAHESKTFETVTAARSGLMNALNNAQSLSGGDMSSEESFEKYTGAQADLAKQFSIYVNAVKEAYPDLKADKQFLDLQTQLEGTENRIATERGYYTQAVQQYNVAVRRFPASVWAGMFGFQKRPQYQAEAAAQSAPKVSFD